MREASQPNDVAWNGVVFVSIKVDTWNFSHLQDFPGEY